jgi:hypothetical protein
MTPCPECEGTFLEDLRQLSLTIANLQYAIADTLTHPLVRPYRDLLQRWAFQRYMDYEDHLIEHLRGRT